MDHAEDTTKFYTDGLVLNRYGQIATHEDCLDNFQNNCDGEMVYYENMNTGNRMIRCYHHAWKAENRQSEIHAEYLHDGVMEE